MPSSQSHNNGVSNVEIDWFLRGKLPEATTPMPIPHRHVGPVVSSPSPTSSATTTPPPPPHDKSIHEALPHVKSGQPEQQIGHVLMRSKSVSEVEGRTDKEKKSGGGGFFRSIFGKKKKADSTESGNSTDSLSSPTSTVSTVQQPTPSRRLLSPVSSLSPSPVPQRRASIDSRPLQKSQTSSSTTELDPRLEEFLQYYKSKGIDKLQKDTIQAKYTEILTPQLPTKKDRKKTKTSFGISDDEDDTSSQTSSIQSSMTEKKSSTVTPKKVDVLGRPIPPHPPKTRLPPAIIKTTHFEVEGPKNIKLDIPSSGMSSTSRLTGFLRRHHSSVSDNSLSRATSITSASECGAIPEKKKQENPQHPQPVVIPGLENLPRLKRVCFDMPVFFNDPPQQIPSRTPRKGEVEILKDGSIVIHKLTAAERRQIMTQSGGGIVVGGTGHLKVIAQPEQQRSPLSSTVTSATTTTTTAKVPGEPTSEKPIVMDDEEEDYAAQKHSITVAAAAAAAEARGKAGGNELRRTSTNNDEEVTVNTGVSKISIDKPMVRHTKSAVSLKSMEARDESDGVFPPLDTKVPLDTLYTRCCHLREILPIPATLKQLKPGSTDPISLLQLRNPKPSLVEVLTFSDFVSVAPVLCVSLDGVSLSSEMLRIILSALAHKPELEKLTLRNTPIDEMGWKLLCWFLTKNRTMSRLDLTQVPSLQTSVQKPAKMTTSSLSVHRMTCNMDSRSDMNWMLMSAAIAARGGVEELVINGAKMNDEEFESLIELAVVIRTSKLGLAYNDLTLRQIEVIAKNAGKMKLVGLDMGYNDLYDKFKPLLKTVEDQDQDYIALQFLSLNSCNLHNEDKAFEEVFNEFSVFKDLKYIDLSNNKSLFPSLMLRLAEWLPIYPRLARIHLDYNDLTQRSIVTFAEMIPFCKSLRYISLVGNKIDAVSAGALANAVKLSNTVMTLDLDYEDVASKYRESIGIYTVRNMQNNMYNDSATSQIPGGQRDMDGLREQLSQLLHEGEDPDPVIVEEFIQRAMKLREHIHETIEELFRLRLQGKLNVEGKEALIRFCFVDASIEKGLDLLNKRSSIHEIFERLQLGSTLANESATDHRKLLGDTVSPTPRSSLSSLNMSRHSSTNLVHYLDSTGNAGLMPFGPSQDDLSDDSDNRHPEPLRDDGDELTRAVADSRMKEEANALKIAGLFRTSNIRESLTQEHIAEIESLSGEKMRQMIMQTNDYRNISDVLAKMKEKGILIGDIYKKEEEISVQPAPSGVLDLETLRNTASNLNDSRNQVVSDGEEDDLSPSDVDSLSSAASEDELGQAYDEILDHLEKTRTNN